MPGPDPLPRALLCAAPRRGAARAAGRSAVRPGHSSRDPLRSASRRGGGILGRGRPVPVGPLRLGRRALHGPRGGGLRRGRGPSRPGRPPGDRGGWPRGAVRLDRGGRPAPRPARVSRVPGPAVLGEARPGARGDALRARLSLEQLRPGGSGAGAARPDPRGHSRSLRRVHGGVAPALDPRGERGDAIALREASLDELLGGRAGDEARQSRGAAGSGSRVERLGGPGSGAPDAGAAGRPSGVGQSEATHRPDPASAR